MIRRSVRLVVRLLVVILPLTILGCDRGVEIEGGNQARNLNAATVEEVPIPTENTQQVAGNKWQPQELKGAKFHLTSEPSEITAYNLRENGMAAGRVHKLGMREMFWKIDPQGRLVICDDSDFATPHSVLRLERWDGDVAYTYNEILKRNETYLRLFPKPLDLQSLLPNRDNDKVTEPGHEPSRASLFHEHHRRHHEMQYPSDATMMRALEAFPDQPYLPLA